MNMIYTKRAFAFVSIFIMLLSLMGSVFAISEQGLPGEVGGTERMNDGAPDGLFDMTPNTTTPIMPRDGDSTTDLPDGDVDTTAAPSTTRAPGTTASPITTSAKDSASEAAMNGIWILVIIIALAAVVAVAIAALMKRR